MPWTFATAWTAAIFFSSLSCWSLARTRGQSGVIYSFLGLMLGPGAGQQIALAAVAAVAGTSTSLLLMTQLEFPVFLKFFESLSLAYPLPTWLFMELTRSGLRPTVLFAWLLLNLALPRLVYGFTTARWWALGESDEDQLASQLLWSWSHVLPLAALSIFLFTLLIWALLAPFSMLVVPVGG